jgi:hypothetical protein
MPATDQSFADDAATVPCVDTNPIAVQKDKLGSANSYINTTAGQRPLFSLIGSRYWIVFDGTDDKLTRAANPMFVRNASGSCAIRYTCAASAKGLFWYAGATGAVGFGVGVGAPGNPGLLGTEIAGLRGGVTGVATGLSHNSAGVLIVTWAALGADVYDFNYYVNNVATFADLGATVNNAGTTASALGGIINGTQLFGGSLREGLWATSVWTTAERALVNAYMGTP